MLLYHWHLLDTRGDRAAVGSELGLDQRLALLYALGFVVIDLVFAELGR